MTSDKNQRSNSGGCVVAFLLLLLLLLACSIPGLLYWGGALQSLSSPSPTIISPVTATSMPCPAQREIIPEREYYTVQKGDTLLGISKKTGAFVNWLRDSNQLGDGSMIGINQQLLLPENNEDCNTCWEFGKECHTEAEWACGWYDARLHYDRCRPADEAVREAYESQFELCRGEHAPKATEPTKKKE